MERNKVRRRRRKNLLGALRRKDDMRLGDENALKIYVRQCENLKNGWSKSEEKTQQGLFIGRGNTPQWRGRNPNKPSFNATRVPLRFTNHQTMMTTEWTASSDTSFEGASMGTSTAWFYLLDFSTKPSVSWVPWFISENRARIKGG